MQRCKTKLPCCKTTTDYAYSEIFDAPKPNSLVLRSRAEVTRKVVIDFSEAEFLIPKQKIVQGILIANTTSSGNTTHKNVFLENVKIKAESLEPYQSSQSNTYY